MLKHLAKIIPFLVLLVLCGKLEAQNFSRHNWFFGNSSEAILFNKSDNQPSLVDIQGTPFGNGGSAVATNPLTGQVLFYTDGLSVFDASHSIMVNGTGLSGLSAANQPVGICPVPNNDDRYYVFTNSANLTSPGNLQYSIVDMSLPGNAGLFAPRLGSVVNVNIPTSVGNTSEAMIIIPNPTFTGCWVVTQDYGTATYRVFEVSAGNFGNVQTFNLGAAGAPPMVAANFAYTPLDGGKIAVSPQNANRNVQILDFNAATGVISFRGIIANTGNTDGGDYAVYDTEWSENGMNLYISRYGMDSAPTGQLLQYDPAAPNIQVVSTPALTRSLGLKLGPDGRIYHLYETASGQFLSGRINRPNQVIDSIGYNATPPEVGSINYNGRQFPEFAFALETPDFEAFMVDGLCTNNPTRFYPQVDPMAERFSWNLGGSTVDLLAPIVTFSSGGPVNISMRYFLNGVEFSYDSVINITQTDLMVQLQDTIICPNESLTFDATAMSNFAPIQYVWHDKSTSPMYTTDTAGVYWVVATDNQGCTSYSSAEVTVCGEENMRSAIWYFGQNAGIDFNDPQRAISGPMNTQEGTATISDRNGNVIFYTDGETVWNREHNVMPNGTNIGGNRESTQSAIIVPFPGDETLFYIFTTEEIFDNSGNDSYLMGYAVVDIKQDMGLGDVVIKNKPLFERSTERLAAFVGGDSTWVVGHEYGTNTFRSYPVGQGGIGNPVLSSVGAVHSIGNAADGEGYMVFNGAGNKLAVAIEGQNAVEIFNFADSTGTLDSLIHIDLNEAPYGLAFSANHLFVTTMNPSKLYRIRIDTTVAAIENTPPLEVFNSGVPLGAIQRSPTGQLFVARQGQNSLGTILGADGPANQVSFQENGFGLAGGTTSELGLPNFVQNIATPTSGPGMVISGFCLEEPTVFEGSGPCQSLDNYEWKVMPQGVDSVVFQSFDQNTEFMFNNPGFYDIELRVHNCNFSFDTTMTQLIEISGKPVLDSIPGFVPLCNGSATIRAASIDTVGLSFLWSTGDTTNTVTITQAGNYTVTVTNSAGCSNSSSFLANPVNPVVNLGFDRIYCLNEPADSLNAGNPNSSFLWQVTRDGTTTSTPADTNRIMDVVTNVPGDYLYIVNVTDNVTACTTTDSVNISVLPPPSLSATANDSPGCGQPDGSIDVDITSSGSFTVEVTDGNIMVSDTSSGPGSVNIPNLSAGVYSVTLRDNINQCTETIDGLTIQDTNAMFLQGQQIIPTSCDFDDGIIRVFFSDVTAFPISYTLRDQTDNSVVATNTINTFNSFPDGVGFEVPGLEPGTYSVEVLSNSNGCTQSLSNLEVTVNADNIDLNVAEFVDGCGNVANILIQTSGQFSVTGPPGSNITPGSVSATVDASGIYTVTASDPNGLFCDSVRTVQVTLAESILVQIDTAAQNCSGTRILTATITNNDPALTYTYQWYFGTISGGTRIQGALTNQLSISEPGTYSVRVGTSQNVCISEATIADVDVRQPVVVTLEAIADCENSASITITALVNQSNVELTWFDPGGIEIPGTRNIFDIDVNQRGNYSVLASTDRDGVVCSTLESINLLDICPPQVFAHNAIRPNSDISANRNFYIHNPNDISDDFQVFIFNRWGEMIFQSSDKNFIWDGTFSGKDVPIGTYPYLMRFKFPDDPQFFEKRGGVAIIR